jgi:hypothetical protein
MSDSTMIRRDMLRWAAAASLVGATAGCGSTPLLRRNYEFEIRYLANGRLLTARVVQQIQYRAYSAAMPSGLVNQRSTEGEGAVVRIPEDGSVIATTLAELAVPVSGTSGLFGTRSPFYGWDLLDFFARALLPSHPLQTETFEALMAIEPPSPWVPLTPDDLPLIVRFVDASDPGSAAWVDQWSETAPIRVVSSRARLTNQRITTGELERLLPWATELKRDGVSALGRVGERSAVSDNLSFSYFIQ